MALFYFFFQTASTTLPQNGHPACPCCFSAAALLFKTECKGTKNIQHTQICLNNSTFYLNRSTSFIQKSVHYCYSYGRFNN